MCDLGFPAWPFQICLPSRQCALLCSYPCVISTLCSGSHLPQGSALSLLLQLSSVFQFSWLGKISTQQTQALSSKKGPKVSVCVGVLYASGRTRDFSHRLNHFLPILFASYKNDILISICPHSVSISQLAQNVERTQALLFTTPSQPNIHHKDEILFDIHIHIELLKKSCY